MAGKINVAIIGVGNCASSLVQGVEFYKNAESGDVIPGLMHPVLGGYHIRDINFVAAFDVDAEKVGKDLSEAIESGQNNTIKFSDVPKTGVTVERGMTLSQAIAKGGGLTLRGTDRGVRVQRRVGRQIQMLEPRLEDPIRPDDLIFVRESVF